MATIYAMQDGADFYYAPERWMLENDLPCGIKPAPDTWRAPFKVADYDTEAATRARKAFKREMFRRACNVEFI